MIICPGDQGEAACLARKSAKVSSLTPAPSKIKPFQSNLSELDQLTNYVSHWIERRIDTASDVIRLYNLPTKIKFFFVRNEKNLIPFFFTLDNLVKR